MSARFLRFREWIRSLSHNGNGCKFSGGDLEAKKYAAEQRQGNQDFCFRRALGLFQTRHEFFKVAKRADHLGNRPATARERIE